MGKLIMEKQSLALEKLLARLRNFVKINDQSEADLDYITCSEYQLFQDFQLAKIVSSEIEDQESYLHQPDHWVSVNPLQSQLHSPLAGIRSTDAIAFCHWMGTNIDPEHIYRLPSLDEESLFSLNKSTLNTWCFDGNRFLLSNFSINFISDLVDSLNRLSNPYSIPLVMQFFFQDNQNYLDSKYQIQRETADNNRSDLFLALDYVLDFNLSSKQTRALAVGTNQDLLCLREFIKAYKVAFSRNPKFKLGHLKDKILKQNFKWTGFDEITKAVEDGNLDLIQSSIHILKLDKSNSIVMSWASIIEDYLSIYRADNFFEMRRAFRSYLLHLTEYAYLGYSLHREARNKSNFNSDIFKYKNEQITLAKLYWQLKIFLAREDGLIPAWEGIRLIREPRIRK